MSVENQELPQPNFVEHRYENITNHDQLDPEIVRGVIQCVTASGMRTSEEDIMEHITGDLVLVLADDKTGEVAAFSSTMIMSPNQYFNVADISDEKACYLQGATVSENRKKLGLYKRMNDRRIDFGLERGVNLVFTQTQNKSVLRGVKSTLDSKKEQGLIGGYEVSSILREGYYGRQLTEDLPDNFEELDSKRGDAYTFLFHLQPIVEQ